ncbi:MAG: hypothetical protein J07HN4v3_01730 [Halonotius sp. J07HN4]|nr:MAG: hypothetical protein J07HN4v3_01730 [Halonotius sp. J07HN4]
METQTIVFKSGSRMQEHEDDDVLEKYTISSET